MASYEVRVGRSAEKQLRRLPGADQDRVTSAISALADDPVPRGVRKLTGYDDVFRIRVGRYRILYEVSGRTLIVAVLKVGHRRAVYR